MDVQQNNSYPAYLAAIDLGSHAFHLLIAAEEDGKITNIVCHERRVVQLGDLSACSELKTSRMQAGWRCLQEFRSILALYTPSAMRITGTAALREAANAPLWITRASEIIGQPLEILTGLEEAKLIYQAASSSGQQVIVDIGGGSTEVAWGEAGCVQACVSLPLGVVRLQRSFPWEALRQVEHWEALLAYCHSHLSEAPLQSIHAGHRQYLTAGMGQVMRQLAYTCGEEAVMTTAWLVTLGHAWLLREPYFEVLSPEKRRLFPYALAILTAYLQCVKATHFESSPKALRDGLLLSLLKEKVE